MRRTAHGRIAMGDWPADLDRLLSQLRDVQPTSPKSWIALCPCHDDSDPSLSVLATPEGGIVPTCFAGCDRNDIREVLGLDWSDLLPRKPAGPISQSWTPVAEYVYVDERHRRLFRVLRYPGKEFRMQRWEEPDGWAWGLADTRRAPYRLPEVLAAVAAGERVYKTEGEKDVNAVERLGLTATCNAGGAGKWDPEFSKYLHGGDVVILADNDTVGRRDADEVARSLWRHARSIRIVNLPGLPDGGDVTDWLEADPERGRADLAAIVDAAPSWTPDQHDGVSAAPLPSVDLQPARPRFTLTTVDELVSRAPPRYQVDGMFRRGGLVFLYGPPEVGKTLVALDIATRIAAGIDFDGAAVEQGRVVFVAAEGADLLGERIAAWQAQHPDAALDALRVIAEPINLFKVGEVDQLLEVIEPLRPAALVFDTLARCSVGADEDSARDMGIVMHHVERIRTRTGATVIIVHHPPKATMDLRGSGALRGAAETVMKLERKGAVLTLSCDKHNAGVRLEPRRFRLQPVADSVVVVPIRSGTSPDELTAKEHELLKLVYRWNGTNDARHTALLKASGWKDRTFGNVRNSLAGKGMIEKAASRRTAPYRLTKRGEQAVRATSANLVPGSNREVGATTTTPPGVVATTTEDEPSNIDDVLDEATAIVLALFPGSEALRPNAMRTRWNHTTWEWEQVPWLVS